MNASLADLIIAALAAWQIVEIWHHSSLFATSRARVELSDGFFSQLLLCPFCLSVWVSMFVAVVVLVDLPRDSDLWSIVGFATLGVAKIVVFGFAVSRLANLGNDVAHKQCRTPRYNALQATDPISVFEDSNVGADPGATTEENGGSPQL